MKNWYQESENVELVPYSAEEAAALLIALKFSLERGADKVGVGKHMKVAHDRLIDTFGHEALEKQINATIDAHKCDDPTCAGCTLKEGKKSITLDKKKKGIMIAMPEDLWAMLCAIMGLWIADNKKLPFDMPKLNEEEKNEMLDFAEGFAKKVIDAIEGSTKSADEAKA